MFRAFSNRFCIEYGWIWHEYGSQFPNGPSPQLVPYSNCQLDGSTLIISDPKNDQPFRVQLNCPKSSSQFLSQAEVLQSENATLRTRMGPMGSHGSTEDSVTVKGTKSCGSCGSCGGVEWRPKRHSVCRRRGPEVHASQILSALESGALDALGGKDARMMMMPWWYLDPSSTHLINMVFYPRSVVFFVSNFWGYLEGVGRYTMDGCEFGSAKRTFEAGLVWRQCRERERIDDIDGQYRDRMR